MLISSAPRANYFAAGLLTVVTILVPSWAFGVDLFFENFEGVPVDCVAFSPRGGMLASCGNDKTARFWDVETGIAHAVLVGHQDAIERLAISPDGKTLATASLDETAKLWDISTDIEDPLAR